MATSRQTKKKPASVTQFPPPETPENAVAVEEPPTPFDPTPTGDQPEAPPRNVGGRPRKDAVQPETNFFSRVAAVPAADWGTRVYLYLYQLEPVCDLKQSGGKSYLMRYQEPVKDEHQIMLEQGSGKYRLMLALNKITPNQSNELAQYNFEIYNPQYPPRVPKEVWVNDPRNRRWEALLPKAAAEKPGSSLETFVDVLRATNDIRREIKEEMTPEPGATPASTAPAAVDPWSAAEKILNMRSENPMVAILQQQMKDAATAAENERARAFTAAEAARDREFKLQQQLLEARTKEPQGKNALDQLLELASMGDKLDPLKKLLGFGNGAGEVAGRVARTTGLDLFRDFILSPSAAPVFQGLGALLSNVTQSAQTQNGQPPRPVVINQQPNPAAVPPVEDPEQRIQRIGAQITQPLIKQFMQGAQGADFAQSMFDMMPEDYAFMRTLGPDNIVDRYRQFPQAWNTLQFREAEFIEFMHEFCTWDPNVDEAPAPGDGDDGIVDLSERAS
jgi:hypothetical protein